MNWKAQANELEALLAEAMLASSRNAEATRKDGPFGRPLDHRRFKDWSSQILAELLDLPEWKDRRAIATYDYASRYIFRRRRQSDLMDTGLSLASN